MWYSEDLFWLQKREIWWLFFVEITGWESTIAKICGLTKKTMYIVHRPTAKSSCTSKNKFTTLSAPTIHAIHVISVKPNLVCIVSWVANITPDLGEYAAMHLTVQPHWFFTFKACSLQVFKFCKLISTMPGCLLWYPYVKHTWLEVFSTFPYLGTGYSHSYNEAPIHRYPGPGHFMLISGVSCCILWISSSTYPFAKFTDTLSLGTPGFFSDLQLWPIYVL